MNVPIDLIFSNSLVCLSIELYPKLMTFVAQLCWMGFFQLFYNYISQIKILLIFFTCVFISIQFK